ncbi:MAG: PQQ-binding-like beta-propeller repeat protein [Verrucomicrobiia bacterium]
MNPKLIAIAALSWLLPFQVRAADASTQAQHLLGAAGVKGGLIVHVGCGDGKLTAALRANDSFIVHGLDTDVASVTTARNVIQSLGLYGVVSVEQWSGERLPYADNLVNLVVAGGECRVASDEILRVLAPNGVALIGGRKIVKPRPGDIDEWTHFLHDAGNNAVAHDTRVGTPRSLQWMAPPLWLRSHETPSGLQAMVCGGGRVFYIFDEGLVGITDQRLPERWALLCRDAFNGKLLWRRPIEKWGWPEWATDRFATTDWTTITGGRTVVPDENQRRLVVDRDRLYATLSYRAPLSILDATTGKTLATIPETAPVRQIIAADGVAVVYSQDAKPETEPVKRKGKGKGKAKDGPPGALIAVQGATGKVLWRKPIPALHALSLAIDGGRVVYLRAKTLSAFDLKTGEERWQAEVAEANIQTLVAHDGVIALLGGKSLEAHDGATGKLLWSKEVHLAHGLGSEGLYVINGVAWPDMLSVDDEQNPGGKSPNVLAIGYDLRTGAEKKRLFVKNLRSPEHHHRCYRNKATERFIISSMEGLEFLDVRGSAHSQNNFVRGACKLGVMPCNGMVYVPPDQCFCDPGAKLLGFTAIGPATAIQPVSDGQRLEKGPAYDPISNLKSQISDSQDWPTFRHDAARHGSTPAAVPTPLAEHWRVKLRGGLSQPVAAGGRVFVASRDTHTLHALNMETGKAAWTFVAGGRIDSPPTLVNGLVLFGSADGYVYCLRADDGALAWRFLAAPSKRNIVVNDQIESVWPVHGSVLVSDGVAYATAGRSTYLDGGIRLYALDPATGKLLHQSTLAGPFPDGKTMREVSFYITGANSDVLVSEGGAIYMRQKRLTPALAEVKSEDLSNKGERDVGLHVFSTAGLLDASWYNRTFWMYSKRWPGFQLANQAPKSGQLLVVDGESTYGVSVFYRRNVHTTMFFPAKEGYLLFADKNANEPQIVGEAGARKPVVWLPQSDYERGRGRPVEKLDNPAFGLDKMIGYTRAEPPLWKLWLPVRIRAMVKAGDTLFAAGTPDVLDPADPYAAFEGRKGASLVSVSAKDGKKLAELRLTAPPIFDGMIAASGRLLVALEDGSLLCMGKE